MLRNIDDISTEARVKRRITIDIDFIPDGSRQAITVAVEVKTKLAPTEKAEGVVFVVRDRQGEPFGVDINPHQPSLFRG